MAVSLVKFVFDVQGAGDQKSSVGNAMDTGGHHASATDRLRQTDAIGKFATEKRSALILCDALICFYHCRDPSEQYDPSRITSEQTNDEAGEVTRDCTNGRKARACYELAIHQSYTPYSSSEITCFVTCVDRQLTWPSIFSPVVRLRSR